MIDHQQEQLERTSSCRHLEADIFTCQQGADKLLGGDGSPPVLLPRHGQSPAGVQLLTVTNGKVANPKSQPDKTEAATRVCPRGRIVELPPSDRRSGRGGMWYGLLVQAGPRASHTRDGWMPISDRYIG